MESNLICMDIIDVSSFILNLYIIFENIEWKMESSIIFIISIKNHTNDSIYNTWIDYY